MDHYLTFIIEIEILRLLNTCLWIQDHEYQISNTKILLKCIVQNINNVQKQQKNTGLYKQNKKNGLNYEWNWPISNIEQLAIALILEGNVG